MHRLDLDVHHVANYSSLCIRVQQQLKSGAEPSEGHRLSYMLFKDNNLDSSDIWSTLFRNLLIVKVRADFGLAVLLMRFNADNLTRAFK